MQYSKDSQLEDFSEKKNLKRLVENQATDSKAERSEPGHDSLKKESYSQALKRMRKEEKEKRLHQEL